MLLAAGFSASHLLSNAAAVVAILTFLGGALWWIHKTVNRVESVLNQELRHNGGSSMKDMVRDARDDARAAGARVAAVEGALADLRVSQTQAELRSAEAIGALKQSVQTMAGEVASTRRALTTHVEDARRAEASLAQVLGDRPLVKVIRPVDLDAS